MQMILTKAVLLALVGTLSAAPVMAAPMSSSTGVTTVDCTLPENINKPYCLDQLNRGKGTGKQGSNGNLNGNQPSSQRSSNDNNGPNNPPSNNGGIYSGPKSGSFNFSQRDRSQFHQRLRGFNFGNFSFFFTPNFTIRIGTALPNTYRTHLRKVPANVYRYYPWFRGYYFFVDRSGDFVIVSPRNFKIVAVL